MKNEDVVKRCARAGIDVYLDVTGARLDEESPCHFSMLALKPELRIELHAADLLPAMRARQA